MRRGVRKNTLFNLLHNYCFFVGVDKPLHYLKSGKGKTFEDLSPISNTIKTTI